MSNRKRTEAVSFYDPIGSAPELREALLEDRRLRILRLLHAAPGFLANDCVLRIALERLGHAVSASRLYADLSWLDEMGLISAVMLDGLMVSKLHDTGADVAIGRSQIPGVSRPSPEN